MNDTHVYFMFRRMFHKAFSDLDEKIAKIRNPEPVMEENIEWDFKPDA